MATYSTEAIDQAWARYRQVLDDARTTLFGCERAQIPRVRDAAHYSFYQAQAAAFNMTIAPRQDYPAFHIHLFSEPMLYPWLLNNPDFLYRMLYLDGSRTYRIWGRRHNTLWIDLQVFSRFWSEPEDQMAVIGNYDLDKFTCSADGSFEIIASAQPHEGNWIRLDPTAPRHAVMMRETFVDWGSETPVEIHIETIDGQAPRPVLHDEAEMIARIDAAGRLMKFVTTRFMAGTVDRGLKNFGKNSFFTSPSSNSAGTNPVAQYWQCIYELAADEALIIETELPRCRYWGVQMTDAWVNTTDYVHHQSSLNRHQARLDSDGRFRAVISQQDPGVPNWLDPVDNLFGEIMVRWYMAESNPRPEIRKVPFDSLRSHLPADTPQLTAEQRKISLRERRIAAQRRYGY